MSYTRPGAGLRHRRLPDALRPRHPRRPNRAAIPHRTRRVDITERARAVLRRMIDQHGAVLLHQSGGRLDSGTPRCLPIRESRIDRADVLLGTLPWHTELWISAEQYEHWKHTHLTVDVAEGPGGSASDALEDSRFVIRSRLLTDEEAAALAAGGPPRTGADRLA
ncbi:DUF779 domain-containing protein [Nocardia sputi]|uniref:DUF779 domain-containing protein n=2 Tax=Nocardiaceae TaxID=85025 RepID=UPI00135B1606|nr:DUF779 domain-containing protein [Nocardia sputi]MBF6204178.1 DUF779 domain-containing protein [Streptomyces gardneri]